MRARAALVSVSAFLVTLALVAPAIAAKGGEGTYGKTNDKVITNFGFGLMIFFVTLVIGLSVAQHLLERRKSRK